MKYISIDLEIVKEIPQDFPDWKALRPLGISCIGLHASQELPIVRYSNCPHDPEPRPMNKEELNEVIGLLEVYLSSGFIPLTWNGLSFDFDVLAEESSQKEKCINLAMKSVDMMFQVLCVKGFRLGLNSVAHGMNLQGKTEGMNGALAPIMWAGDVERLKQADPNSPFLNMSPAEMRSKCLEYVKQDAVTTLELAEKTETIGYFTWISKNMKANYFLLPSDKKRWLTVEECLQLPLPDTSWMSSPIKREDMYAWMK